MKGLLVDVENENVRVVDIDGSLDAYYEVLGCDLIDVTERCIAGRWYDVVCDDEGLLKSNPKVSAVDNNNEPVLVGNLLLTHHDDEGHLTSLTDEDIEYSAEFMRRVYTEKNPDGYMIVTQCEWSD